MGGAGQSAGQSGQFRMVRHDIFPLLPIRQSFTGEPTVARALISRVPFAWLKLILCDDWPALCGFLCTTMCVYLGLPEGVPVLSRLLRRRRLSTVGPSALEMAQSACSVLGCHLGKPSLVNLGSKRPRSFSLALLSERRLSSLVPPGPRCIATSRFLGKVLRTRFEAP